MLLRVPLLCSFGQAWCLFVQSGAKIKRCLINRFLAGLGPKVKLVSGSTALETPEHVPVKVRRESAVFPVFGRFVQRTFASHLVAAPFENGKPQKFKDFSHRYVGSKLPKVNARHGC